MTAKTKTKTTEKLAAPAAPAAPKPFSAGAARRAAAAERTVYGAAGLTTAIGPQLDMVPLHVGAVTVGAGTLWHLWRRSRQDSGQLLTACGRALPWLGLSGAYAAALVTPGAAWWEVAAPLTVAAAAAVSAPWTRSRGVRREIEQLPETIAAAVAELPAGTGDAYLDGLARLWTSSPATGETQLTRLRQLTPGRPDFTTVILAPVGQAVPSTVTATAVAAVYDVPAEAVLLEQVPGSGPGRQRLTVTVPSGPIGGDGVQGEALIRHIWEERVCGAGGYAPGMLLKEIRMEPDRIRLRVRAEEGRMVSLSRTAIARAFQIPDVELVMVATDKLATAVVSIYREHPLISIREARVEDLTMRTDGTIAIGLEHDGRVTRWPLHDPELGALTDLVVGAMGSGKSVTLNHLIAAERISGVVSVVADAQNGMSLPEAKGRVYHFGSGIAALGATLAAACAVGDYREQISAENGWGSFVLGDPWPLLIITLDEINKVLSQDADVPEEFKKWVVGLISHFQTTGRKFGGGLRFAGQSIHVRDLGHAEKIRANAKNGTVWLGRVNSSITSTMATDMVTDGTEVTPIPRYFGSVADDVAAAWDEDEAPKGPPTAGRAWMLQGGRAHAMRTFKAVKKDRSFTGLIRLYESAPIPQLTPEEDEIFRAAYAQALPAAEQLLEGTADDEEEHEHLADKTEKPKRRAEAVKVPTPKAALADRVLKVLRAEGGPLRTRDIRSALGVGTEGGPAAGSVDNALSKLFDAGEAVRVGHGTWAALDSQTD